MGRPRGTRKFAIICRIALPGAALVETKNVRDLNSIEAGLEFLEDMDLRRGSADQGLVFR